MDNTAQPTEWQSKQHFHVLDGLRGVAALAVVVFHFMEWVIADYTQNFIGHGFLAVDFFFCLSGFVIGYAYDSRLPHMGLRAFFTARLIRLHPLVLAGTVLGIIGLVADPFADNTSGHSWTYFFITFISSVFLIPLPIMEERGFNLFGLNAPAWSLFWEYIANILYAFILIRLPKKALWILVIMAAGGILWVSHHSGNLMGGWSGGTFADGGVRMVYSFMAGLLIYRCGWVIRHRLGFVVMALLLLVALLMPSSSLNWLTESIAVLVYFPLLVALGAGAAVSGASEKVCVFFGKISYPLYMTHYVGIWWFGNYLITHHPATDTLVPVITVGTLALVLFAYLVMTFYDQPLRGFLTRKTKARQSAVANDFSRLDSLFRFLKKMI